MLELRSNAPRKIVSFFDVVPSTLSNARHRARVTQSPMNGTRKIIGREEVHEQPVVTIANDLFNRRRRRADHQAACRHGLEHRPRENEGIGEVDVSCGNPELSVVRYFETDGRLT